MSIQSYEEEMAKQFSYLDQIDIEKYMKNCTTGKIGELINAIERDYDNTDLTDNDFLQGCIFNYCNEEEFVEYLAERYGKRFSTTEHFYRTFSFK